MSKDSPYLPTGFTQRETSIFQVLALSWDSSNCSPKNMQEIQFLPCEQRKIHQHRISHLIKRKSFMTGDPETRNASPELLSTPKKTQHWRAFSVKVWSMFWVRRWQRMLYTTVFTTGCTPLLCRMSSWQLSGVFPVWAGVICFLVILKPFIFHQV